jgi:hypothetical protein
MMVPGIYVDRAGQVIASSGAAVNGLGNKVIPCDWKTVGGGLGELAP